jgi:hypothetical protein
VNNQCQKKVLWFQTFLVVCICFGIPFSFGTEAVTITIPAITGSVLDLEIDGTFDFVVNSMVMGLGHISDTRDQRTITEFNLANIPDSVVIQSARFVAFIYGGVGDVPTIDVYGFTGDGVVTLADGYETAHNLTTFQGESGIYVDLDMTNFVKSLYGLEQFAGLHFRNMTFGTSREFDPNVGNTPQLVVTYEQIPPTPTPIPTPACSSLGVEIWMPSDFFHAGDECSCIVYVCNPGTYTYSQLPLFVILDVYGSLFFAPAFNDYSYYIINVPPGFLMNGVLASFQWPAGAGEFHNIRWYAGITDSTITTIIGDSDAFTFGWDS